MDPYKGGDFPPWRMLVGESALDFLEKAPDEVREHLVAEHFDSLPDEALDAYQVFRGDAPIAWGPLARRVADFLNSPFSSSGGAFYTTDLMVLSPRSGRYSLVMRGSDLYGGSHLAVVWQDLSGNVDIAPFMVTTRESIVAISGLVGVDARRQS